MEPGNTNADQEWGMHLCKLESFLPMGFQRHGLETNMQSVAFSFQYWLWWTFVHLFFKKSLKTLYTHSWAMWSVSVLFCICIWKLVPETFYTYSWTVWQSNPRESLPPKGKGLDISIMQAAVRKVIYLRICLELDNRYINCVGKFAFKNYNLDCSIMHPEVIDLGTCLVP